MQALEGTETHIGLANGEAWELIKFDQAGIGRVWRHVLGVAAPDHRLAQFPMNKDTEGFSDARPSAPFNRHGCPC